MLYIIIILLIIISLGLSIRQNKRKFRFLTDNADKKTFVCPSCGHRFHPKWYQMVFSIPAIDLYNSAKLRCPACHKWDMCTISHDER